MNRKIQKECESGCEYILPDYMGDIKKLLMSRARAVPTGKFVGEGSLEVSGIVEYEILYADSENKLTAINTSSDFTEVFAINDEGYIDSADESRISNVKIRITGPRKMFLKADVQTVAFISEETPLTVEGEAFNEGKGVEKCTRVINYSNSIFKKSGEREYAEVAERLAETSADDVEVISVSADVRIEEAKAGDGEVLIKGKSIVNAIMQSADRAAPFKIKKDIPFEERIEVEGARAGMLALANGFISSANIGLGSENGECVAVANIIAEYSVEVLENISEEVILDAYFTDKETVNKYCDTEYYESVYAAVKELDIEIKGDKESLSIGEAKEILALSSEVRSCSAALSKNGCELSGEISISGVACEVNVDGTVGYIPVKMQAPFSKNVNFDCQIPDGSMLEYTVSVSDAEADMNFDELTVRCSATVKLYVTSPKCVRRLLSSDAEESEEAKKDTSTVTVYYPKAGERLFDVAKRYKTTSAKIALDNKLSESALSSVDSPDSLIGVKRLIIM